MKEKFSKKLLTLVMALAMVFTACDVLPVEANAAATDAVPIYRLYNPNTGEHLYTASAYEKDVLYTYWGWGYEGIAWYSSTNTGDPVYRLYQPELGNHLYTTNTGEIEILTSSYGWTMDFDGKPLFYSNGSIPIYRVFNIGMNGLHHWTTNQGEYDILPQYGWAQEGAQFSAVKMGELTGRTDYCPLTIENVNSYAAIEADVTLTGSGTGCHAKLVVCTPTAAVSYGLQYDQYASAPYTGKTMLMLENVGSNAAGGQTYTRPNNIELALGQTYHLMMTYNQDGTGSLYLNNQLVGSYANPNLANQYVYLRVEGSARKNGDSVNAAFTNIKLKNGGTYNADKKWNTHFYQENPTITYTANSWDNIVISGYISGLGANDDWDNKYESCSGIIQYN